MRVMPSGRGRTMETWNRIMTGGDSWVPVWNMDAVKCTHVPKGPPTKQVPGSAGSLVPQQGPRPPGKLPCSVKR